MLLTIPHWLQETMIGVCVCVCLRGTGLDVWLLVICTYLSLLLKPGLSFWGCVSQVGVPWRRTWRLHLSVTWTDTRHGARKTTCPHCSVKNIKQSLQKKSLKATLYPPGSTQIRDVVTVKNHQTLTSTACGNSRQCCGKCGSLFKQLPPEKRRHLCSLLAMDRPSKVSSPSSENRVKVWKIWQITRALVDRPQPAPELPPRPGLWVAPWKRVNVQVAKFKVLIVILVFICQVTNSVRLNTNKDKCKVCRGGTRSC